MKNQRRKSLALSLFIYFFSIYYFHDCLFESKHGIYGTCQIIFNTKTDIEELIKALVTKLYLFLRLYCIMVNVSLICTLYRLVSEDVKRMKFNCQFFMNKLIWASKKMHMYYTKSLYYVKLFWNYWSHSWATALFSLLNSRLPVCVTALWFKQLQLAPSTTSRMSNGKALTGAKSLALGDTISVSPFQCSVKYAVMFIISKCRTELISILYQSLFPHFSLPSVWRMCVI